MNTPDSSYREIPLSKGQVAIVDECDYEELSRHKWYATWNRDVKGYYATRHASKKTSNGYVMFMHREILGLKKGDKRTGDHAQHVTLDNRRVVNGKPNLRIASRAEQGFNRRRPSTNRSGYKGVSFHAGAQKWQAHIMANGEHVYLGLRDTAKAAHEELYLPALDKYHGDFACAV